MEDSIEQVVSYFRHAAQGLEEKKQILYLLGPVGGGKSSIAERLKQLAGLKAPVDAFFDGVMVNADDPALRANRLALLGTLEERFPHHTIYCDLMRKNFFEKYSRDIHVKIVGMGATFTGGRQTFQSAYDDQQYFGG